MPRPQPGTIEHARYVREARALALSKLERGEVSLRGLLLEPRGPLQGVAIYTLLETPPGLGPRTARKLCERHQLWPLTTLYNLTLMQRECLIHDLDERST